MRKHIEKPNKPEKTAFSVKKVLIIALIFFIAVGTMGVMASNVQLKNVKIILASGYERNVVTTSTKVKDILEEYDIEVLESQDVTPGLDEEISDNKTITIIEGKKEEISTETYFSEEEILESYQSIIEKTVTIQEEIPFQTITEDISGGSESTQDKVVQEGENGIKEITYRIQYKDGVEISKEVISEKVIKEPVDKKVQINTKVVTARSSASRATSGSVADYQSYAWQRCQEYGWGEDDFDALVSLWNRESGWNPYAENGYSGAYGIPQALPASKMSSYGSDYLSNYQTQIDWGLGYISGRYGSPSNAWEHSESTGWY